MRKPYRGDEKYNPDYNKWENRYEYFRKTYYFFICRNVVLFLVMFLVVIYTPIFSYIYSYIVTCVSILLDKYSLPSNKSIIFIIVALLWCLIFKVIAFILFNIPYISTMRKELEKEQELLEKTIDTKYVPSNANGHSELQFYRDMWKLAAEMEAEAKYQADLDEYNHILDEEDELLLSK